MNFVITSTRLPIGISYLLLALFALPFHALSAMTMIVVAAVVGSREEASDFASVLKLRLKFNRTVQWISRDVPPPWEHDPYMYH